MNHTPIRTTPTVEIEETARAFVITARSAFGTTYLATLPICWCEGRTPCVAGYEHGKTVKTAAPGCDGSERKHCHGLHAYHREHAERYVADVARTFKPWKPRPHTLPGITAWMRTTDRFGRSRVLAPCPTWPVIDDLPKTLPALCDCESCRGTLARFERRAVAA